VLKAVEIEPPASIQEIGISSLKVRKVPDEVLAVKKAVNISKDENTIHSRTVNSQSPMDAILVDDSEWVLEQAEKQYTIQLMVLSRRQSVLDFVNHNKSLQDELRYFKINRLGKRLFVLVYGSYELFETAAEEMKSLPSYRNYLIWSNQLKIGFVSVCDIPNYDVAANISLGKIIEECYNL